MSKSIRDLKAEIKEAEEWNRHKRKVGYELYDSFGAKAFSNRAGGAPKSDFENALYSYLGARSVTDETKGTLASSYSDFETALKGDFENKISAFREKEKQRIEDYFDYNQVMKTRSMFGETNHLDRMYSAGLNEDAISKFREGEKIVKWKGSDKTIYYTEDEVNELDEHIKSLKQERLDSAESNFRVNQETADRRLLLKKYEENKAANLEKQKAEKEARAKMNKAAMKEVESGSLLGTKISGNLDYMTRGFLNSEDKFGVRMFAGQRHWRDIQAGKERPDIFGKSTLTAVEPIKQSLTNALAGEVSSTDERPPMTSPGTPLSGQPSSTEASDLAKGQTQQMTQGQSTANNLLGDSSNTLASSQAQGNLESRVATLEQRMEGTTPGAGAGQANDMAPNPGGFQPQAPVDMSPQPGYKTKSALLKEQMDQGLSTIISKDADALLGTNQSTQMRKYIDENFQNMSASQRQNFIRDQFDITKNLDNFYEIGKKMGMFSYSKEYFDIDMANEGEREEMQNKFLQFSGLSNLY